MPKPLTKDDIKLLVKCIETEIKSNKVSQGRSKSPIIEAAFQQHEATLNELKGKLITE